MSKVLLVDDEEQVLRMLSAFLEREGFTVLTASSAAAGKAMLSDQISAVVTDLRMETPLAGFELVREAAKLNPRPYIVVLTAFPVPRCDWKDAGADALFLKSSTTFTLAKQLKSILAARA